MQTFHITEWDEKIIVNGDEVGIWKKVVACLKKICLERMR
jgi:hypothetical protein